MGAGLGGNLAGRDLVSIRELADNPIHVVPRTRRVENNLGGLVEETVNFATWFTPVASGGTPMCHALYHAWELGVPVAGVQKTTIRTFAVNSEEENEGLRPHIRRTKTPDFVHVYCGILPMNRVFFLASAVSLAYAPQAGRVFQGR